MFNTDKTDVNDQTLTKKQKVIKIFATLILILVATLNFIYKRVYFSFVCVAIWVFIALIFRRKLNVTRYIAFITGVVNVPLAICSVYTHQNFKYAMDTAEILYPKASVNMFIDYYDNNIIPEEIIQRTTKLSDYNQQVVTEWIMIDVLANYLTENEELTFEDCGVTYEEVASIAEEISQKNLKKFDEIKSNP